jgi:hypothetical protein
LLLLPFGDIEIDRLNVGIVFLEVRRVASDVEEIVCGGAACVSGNGAAVETETAAA